MKHYLNTFDERMLRATKRWPEEFRPVMAWCSRMGHPVYVAVVFAVVFLGAVAAGWREAAMAAFLFSAALPIATALKIVLHRRRPDTYRPGRFKSYSFPSGHAYGTLLAAGLLGALAYRQLDDLLIAMTWTVLALYVFITGTARVFLGAHYPSDVAGGWLIAFPTLAVIVLITGV